MEFNLDSCNGNDLKGLYKNKPDKELLEKLDLKLKKQKGYSILNYNKENIDRGNIEITGLFRSVIFKNNKILSFSPPKSFDIFDYMKECNINNCVLEEFIEGTMINLFYDNEVEEWEISTKKTIGGDVMFFNKGVYEKNKTFRYMFLDACNKVNFEFDLLPKNKCYSFVLQHPDNRIVSNIHIIKLFLVDVYRIDNYKISRVDKTSILKYLEGTSVMIPKIYKNDYNTYEQICESFASNNTHYENLGVMLYDSKTHKRSKFRNPNYEYVKRLRGNRPKLEYQYLQLRGMGKVKEYLIYFPEHINDFFIYREKIHKFTNELHKKYVSCFIKKENKLKYYKYEYRVHLYNLHKVYLESLNSLNICLINKSIVIKYINSLHPSRLMFSLNYDKRKKN